MLAIQTANQHLPHEAAMSKSRERRKPRSRFRADGTRNRARGEWIARAPSAEYWKSRQQAEREDTDTNGCARDNNWWTYEIMDALLRAQGTCSSAPADANKSARAPRAQATHAPSCLQTETCCDATYLHSAALHDPAGETECLEPPFLRKQLPKEARCQKQKADHTRGISQLLPALSAQLTDMDAREPRSSHPKTHQQTFRQRQA